MIFQLFRLEFNEPVCSFLLRITLFILCSKSLIAQSIFWDDTEEKNWPAVFREVSIPSTLDTHQQKAYFYKSSAAKPQPLIVSLHTWSGDYRQQDPLIGQILTYGWNYIHPDFRGANNTPDACGSAKVIQDIDDAIAFALEHANIDASEIHIIGASGGGMATLLAYMNSRHPIKTFSAWVPISDLEDWYYETQNRKLKYAGHIEIATKSELGNLNVQEVQKRSPYFMTLPKQQRKNSKLYLYAGIHDGYEGSVPITQSIHFYNKLIEDWGIEVQHKIPEKDIIELLSKRGFVDAPKVRTIGGSKMHYFKGTDKVNLIIFEGKHEMLVKAALQHIQPLHIVTIGDSNGAATNGWVTQLQKLRSKDQMSNFSISGNTIGFDNLDNEKLNTLKNIENYLAQAEKQDDIDLVVIFLGTNDCKKVFDKQQKEVITNMRQLIRKIKKYPFKGEKPKFLLVAPPPYGKDNLLIEKYRGAAKRLEKLIPAFKKIAEQENITYTDLHTNMEALLLPYSVDGVHFDTPAYQTMAWKISGSINEISHSQKTVK